jgi:hypothetical protein
MDEPDLLGTKRKLWLPSVEWVLAIPGMLSDEYGMKRIAWATDLHLEFVVSPAKIDALCEAILAEGAEILLIAGDTATANSFRKTMRGTANGNNGPLCQPQN